MNEQESEKFGNGLFFICLMIVVVLAALALAT